MLRISTNNQFVIIGSYANIRTTTFFDEAKKYFVKNEPVIAEGYSPNLVEGTGHYHETVVMIDEKLKFFRTISGDLYTTRQVVELFEKTEGFLDSEEYCALVEEKKESEDIKLVNKSRYFMNFSRGMKTKSLDRAASWLKKSDLVKLVFGISGKSKNGSEINCSMWTSKIRKIYKEGIVVTEADKLYLVK